MICPANSSNFISRMFTITYRNFNNNEPRLAEIINWKGYAKLRHAERQPFRYRIIVSLMGFTIFIQSFRFVNCVKPKSIIRNTETFMINISIDKVWGLGERSRGMRRTCSNFNYNSMTLTTCLLVVFVFIIHSYLLCKHVYIYIIFFFFLLFLLNSFAIVVETLTRRQLFFQ